MNKRTRTWKRTFRGLLAPLLAVIVVACAATEPKDEELVDAIRAGAQEAEADGDYKSASVHYRKLAALRPTDSRALLSYSRSLRLSNAAQEAVSVMSTAKGTKEDRPEFIIELSKAEISAGKSASALARLSVLSTKQGENWELHATMGIAYDMLGSYAQAWQAYLKAAQISPNNPAIINNMALSTASSGRLDKAISILEEASPKVRNVPRVRQNLAMLYGVRGDSEKAEALSRMDLDERDVRNNMAIYSRLGGEIPVDIPKQP